MEYSKDNSYSRKTDALRDMPAEGDDFSEQYCLLSKL
jgi:hypothetical protein